MRDKRDAIFILVVSIIATPILLFFATVEDNLFIYSGALLSSYWAYKSMKFLSLYKEGKIEE